MRAVGGISLPSIFQRAHAALQTILAAYLSIRLNKAERFGMVVDRFGIPWLINCEAAASPDQPPRA